MTVETTRVLLTGASGYVGGRLVPALLDTGCSVRCLARTPAKLDRAPWQATPCATSTSPCTSCTRSARVRAGRERSSTTRRTSPAKLQPARSAHRVPRHHLVAVVEVVDDHDLVCEHGDGRPLDPMSFTHGFARIADKVGLGDVRLHDLRHAIGTSLAKSGTPLTVTSRLLGHSSTAFTAQTYQHADEEMIERAARGLEDAFGA